MNPILRYLWLEKGATTDASVPTFAKILNILLAVIIMSAILFFSLASLSYTWVWDSVWERRQMLWQGWLTTLVISVSALVLSTLSGFILALLSRVHFLPVRYGVRTFVEIVRALPLIVVILLIWYGFGGVFLWPASYRFPAGILILTLFESAYICEIIRSGIESISQSQLESARAVGFTRIQTYIYVILPQSIRQILPPLAGELVSLTKNSSLLYVISIPELTQNAQEVNSQTFSTLETYLPLALGYLIINLPISMFSRWLEAHFKYET